jgi:hypothetical protein
MEAHIASILVYLIGAAVVGLVAWVASLSKSHAAHKLHVAENYIKKDGIQELQQDVKNLSNLMHEIAGKLGVTFRA